MFNEIPITPIGLNILLKSYNPSVGKNMEQLKLSFTFRESVNAPFKIAI